MTTLALPTAVKPRGTPINDPQAFAPFHSPGPTSLAAVCVKLEPDVDGFLLLVDIERDLTVWHSAHISGDNGEDADPSDTRGYTFTLPENAYMLAPSSSDNYQWRMAGTGEGKVEIHPYVFLTEAPDGE